MSLPSWLRRISVKRIRAIAKKEFLHILRDRRTLMMIVTMPLFQLIIYGYGINNDVKHLATVLHDEDKTSMSRRLVESFEQSSYFDVIKSVDSPQEFRKAIDRGEAKAGLHIPPEFSRDVMAGLSPAVQMAIDGSDSNPANTALNTSRAIVQAFIQKESLIPAETLPVDFRPRMWYNPDLKTPFFMVPGLVGLLLQVLIPMITASAIVREKERGNIEQLLVTPVKSYEIMIGKLIPYIGIGMLIAAAIIVASRVLFHIPIRGNMFTLFTLTFLFLTVCLGIGLLASTVADNQQQAAQMVMFIVPPSILLSGYIFPREGMPFPIYVISHFIPLTYFVQIIRGIILKGLGFADLWPQILPLFAMAVLVLGISIRKFNKRLA